MNIATLPTTDDEHVADQLVNRAASTLDREGGGVRAAFLKHLFAHVAPEDLVDYQPGELGEFLVGEGVEDAAAGDDQRPFRGADGLGGAADLVVVGFGAANPPFAFTTPIRRAMAIA